MIQANKQASKRTIQVNKQSKQANNPSSTQYVNSSMSEFFRLFDNQQWFSYPHTTQQNGLAERKQRHIVDITWTLLDASHAPLKLWVEIGLTSVHLINFLPTLHYLGHHLVLFFFNVLHPTLSCVPLVVRVFLFLDLMLRIN